MIAPFRLGLNNLAYVLNPLFFLGSFVDIIIVYIVVKTPYAERNVAGVEGEEKRKQEENFNYFPLVRDRLFGQYRKFSDTGTLDIIGVAYGF